MVYPELALMGQYFIQLSASDSTVVHFGFPYQTALQWSHTRGGKSTYRVIYCQWVQGLPDLLCLLLVDKNETAQ